ITTGWEEDGRIRVYTHPGLADVRNPWPATQVGLAPSAEDAVFADLDGDGAVDVVGSTEGDERSVYVYWNPGAVGGDWMRERPCGARAPVDVRGSGPGGRGERHRRHR